MQQWWAFWQKECGTHAHIVVSHPTRGYVGVIRVEESPIPGDDRIIKIVSPQGSVEIVIHFDGDIRIIRINGVETPDSWKEYENAVRNWPNVCRAEAVKEVIDKAVMERYEKGERMSQEEIERLSQETWDDLLKKEQGEG